MCLYTTFMSQSAPQYEMGKEKGTRSKKTKEAKKQKKLNWTGSVQSSFPGASASEVCTVSCGGGAVMGSS